MKRLLDETVGAIVVMSLFTTTFLVGVIWYLVGVGDTLVFHETLQDGADAVAFAPSVVHARGMNLIALTNLVMASTLAVLIAVKVVQLLLFAANVVACVSQSWGDCAYLASQQAPFAQFVQQVDQDVSDAHRVLSATATSLARHTPKVAARRGAEQAKRYAPVVRGGFATSLSLVPGEVEGQLGGQLSDVGERATSRRLGLPVEDDEFQNLCVHAGVVGSGVVPILWEAVQTYSDASGLERTVLEYAGALQLPVALAYPRLFCGGGGLPSDGPLGNLGRSIRVVQRATCPQGFRQRSLRGACEDGLGAAMSSIRGGSSLGGSAAKRIYAPARMGDDYFATWGVTTSDAVEKDEAPKGVAIALHGRRAPRGTAWAEDELARTLRETQIAKSEVYYDAGGERSWASVSAEGLWNLRWKARLRRVRQPNADLARLLAGSGATYVEDAARGSGSDVGRVLDRLVAASPEELADWAEKNVGKLEVTSATGGMVH